MLAFFGNLAPLELVVIAVVAVVVFGRRLPKVAGKALVQLSRLRRSMNDLRRETGIDRELREIQRSVSETVREVTVEDTPRTPPQAKIPRYEVEASAEKPADAHEGREKRAPEPEAED